MSDIALIILAVVGVLVAAGLPLLAYSMLPQKAMDLASQHGRFSGLGAHDHADSSAGNTPVRAIGSLQGQTA
jgi:hypothetical protein